MSRPTQAAADWRQHFFEFDDVVYLNAAAQGPLPRSAARALQQALEWKKNPATLPDSAYFELPNRVRQLLAQMLGADPREFAITTGASAGLAAVAAGLPWSPQDEVLLAEGEFPAHFATWMPLAEAGRLRVNIVRATRQRFLTAEDVLDGLTPRTRLISISLVRFENAARIDAARLATACRAVGALLLLDLSQCAGAMPLDLRALGADFAVCSGYKWLLSPYGTGFFWLRRELLDSERFFAPAPFYWMALEGAEQFESLGRNDWRPVADARRWDAPETGSFFNLLPMAAALEFLCRMGVATIWEHNQRLLSLLVERLPRDRCVLASPADPAARGPFLCIAGRSPSSTAVLHQKLRENKVVVSLRQGALRIAPHLYNTERDIDRLLTLLAV
ncbi:MAG: aminotransferase class V-fold PLP-dependent enzyme [Firmicutes bacterium]|nr:aminotransferase class V-fold PLP-dependent enzyme [Bacillota bacterium]